MPIYEYQCQACEHMFETIQRISEPAPSECPDCGKTELKKLVSAAAFRLKGSGWYETDFKSGNKKNVSESDDRATSDSGDSSSDNSSGGSSDGSGSSGSGESSSPAKPAKTETGNGEAKRKSGAKPADS